MQGPAGASAGFMMASDISILCRFSDANALSATASRWGGAQEEEEVLAATQDLNEVS